MINFREYYEFLKKQALLYHFYYQEFENLAKASDYMRSNKIVKKYQKELERKKTASFNILNDIFKAEVKSKGVTAIVKVETEKDSKIKLFFKKIFRIKPPVISGIIEEFSENPFSPPDNFYKPEVESEAWIDEEMDNLEISADDYDDEDFEDDWEEEAEDFFDDDRIEGQMDIEDLNEGEVYEKT